MTRCSFEVVSLVPTISTAGDKIPQTPVVFLMGPTAVGKTMLAVELAARFPLDVISVDAAQVYRGMDIGTAKPSAEILNQVPHRLIDICDPWERYSAGRFRTDALREIANTIQSGRIPLLVGGTMFYFQALADGLSDLPASSSAVRAELNRAGDHKGWPRLHEELMRIDPVAAQKVSPHDAQRIMRLLQIYSSQGTKPSEIMRKSRPQPLPYNLLKIAVVNSDRTLLKSVIEQRFQEMLNQGFLQEAQTLFDSPQFDISLPAMRSVGYKQAWQFLQNKITRNEMVNASVSATCAMAKRQLTWIRNNSNTLWAVRGCGDPLELVSRLLERALDNSAFSL